MNPNPNPNPNPSPNPNPEQVRSKPLAWPGRVADGVAKSLVSLAPKNRDDPVNVKYALLCASFLLFTATPALASPAFPISVGS